MGGHEETRRKGKEGRKGATTILRWTEKTHLEAHRTPQRVIGNRDLLNGPMDAAKTPKQTFRVRNLELSKGLLGNGFLGGHIFGVMAVWRYCCRQERFFGGNDLSGGGISQKRR